MESILFFIKRKKLLKDGTAPVYVRITVKKLSAEITTKKSILPSSALLELRIDEVEKEYLTKDESERLIKKKFEIDRLRYFFYFVAS